MAAVSDGCGGATAARQSGQDGVVRSQASTQAAWNAWRHAGSSRSSASGVNGDRQTAQSGELLGSAASAALVVARYAFGGGSTYAHAVVAFARDASLRALAAELLLCPFTILLLLLRLGRRQPEPPEEVILVRDSNFQPVPLVPE